MSCFLVFSSLGYPSLFPSLIRFFSSSPSFHSSLCTGPTFLLPPFYPPFFPTSLPSFFPLYPLPSSLPPSLSLSPLGRPRSYSNSSDADIPSLSPPISPDAKVRSSSLTQLDRQTHHQSTPPVQSPLATQSYSYAQYQREHIMDSLNIFN